MRLPKIAKDVLRPIYYGSIRFAATSVRMLFTGIRAVMGPKYFLKAAHFVRAGIDTSIKVEGIRFDGGNQIPMYRATTLLTKEPDTIAWINDVVAEGDVFYDVGANIGVFTLYTAIAKKAQVVAFEPSAENYAILNRNIHMNGISDRVLALNLAMHNKTMVSVLNLSALMPGKAGHGFEISVAGSHFKAYEPEFRQAVLGFRIDDFIRMFDVPFPNHVKIDVDGNDPLVLEGLGELIFDPRLKSIAIEVNPASRPADRAIADKLIAAGYDMLAGDRFLNQVQISHGMAYNYFFVRKAATSPTAAG